MKFETRGADSKKHGVYAAALAFTFVLIVWSTAFRGSFVRVTDTLYTFLSEKFGWLYLLVIFAFVAFCLILAFSRYGQKRLGADDATPRYSTVSWFAMLFCAGMGVGLVFWGVAEPLTHFEDPLGVEAGTEAAACFAMQASFMHWGLHPWAIYGILGLSMAYFSFRKGEKLLVSSTLIPVIGRKRAQGVVGKVVDVLTVVITATGISTTLGLSALQINGGISHLFPAVCVDLHTQIVIIVISAAAFIASAVSGVDKGVKTLSNINLALTLVFCTAAFIVGPQLEILNNLVSGMGDYLSGLIRESLHLSAYGGNEWVVNWRIFYWAWWISWAPFVGAFIARISEGRTIREFVLGVLIVPTIASCIWFAVFGSLGIHLGMDGILSHEVLAEAVNTPETALFTVLEQYPLHFPLSVLAMLLLFFFFITSADSGTLVLGIFSSDGQQEPSNLRKIVWGVIISLLAVGLLASGGLTSVQRVSIIMAFPFLFILPCCGCAVVKSLWKEDMTRKRKV